MASFTVRVELHRADADEYEMLHQEMAAKGFRRTISSGNGKRYKLPDAEYNYTSGNESRNDVLVKAYNTASSVKPHPAVLVTESAGRTWRGLDSI